MAAPPSIPLHCNICPKKPRFSDVSHLLTHIASKSHLSHYYKIKVRSGTDSTSKAVIDAYDQWYANWDVERLMSERMNTKDKKKQRSKPGVSNRSGPTASSTDIPPPKRALPASHDSIDPRLGGQHIKYESPIPVFSSNSDVLGHATFNGIEGPHFPSWRLKQETLTPVPVPFTQVAVGSAGVLYQDSLESTADGDDLDDLSLDSSLPSMDNSQSLRSVKLKGVKFPGMALFDSATEEMQKKRNQKKDVSVLEQLVKNSGLVEPDEYVYSPNMSVSKKRKIFDLLQLTSSPEVPVRRKRNPDSLAWSREPLSERAFNGATSYVRPSLHQQPYGGGLLPFHTGSHDPAVPLNDGKGRKRKKPVEVYRDADLSFNHPAPMMLLTSEFHHPFDEQRPLAPVSAPWDGSFLGENRDAYAPALHPQISTGANLIMSTYSGQNYLQPGNNTLDQYRYTGTYSYTGLQFNSFQSDIPADFHNLGINQLPFHGCQLPSGANLEEDDDDRTISDPPSDK